MTGSVDGTVLNLVTFVAPCELLMFSLVLPVLLLLSSVLMSIMCVV
jgi:hypothetical protein